MKKVIYITSFTILGLILSTLVHGVVELFALDIIFSNPEQYADTFWWQEWSWLHQVFSVVLWLGGLVGGVLAGIYYWNVVYVQKRHWSFTRKP